MRVLIVSQYFPPEPFRVGDLAQALKQRGHQVSVITGFPNYPNGRIYDGFKVRLLQREDYHGVDVIRVPIYPDTSYSKIKRGLNYLSFALAAALIGPFVINHVDRIIVFQLSPVTVGFPAVFLRWLRRAPVLFWIQDIWPESLSDSGLVKNRRVLALIGSMADFLYRHSDRILVQSQGFIPRLLGRNVPEEKIRYVPNWAEDLYQVHPADDGLMQVEGLANRFNVVFAGNLGAAQGLETIIEAAELLREHPHIQFVILGSGARMPYLIAEVERRRLTNVVFKGRKPVESMPAWFAAADSLLVHLKRSPLFAITIPSKIQSYLACGRPIIAALEGSGAEVVREADAGITCEPENPTALAAAVLQMYRTDRLRREVMGKNGRCYYEETFSREKILSRLEAILQEGTGSVTDIAKIPD